MKMKNSYHLPPNMPADFSRAATIKMIADYLRNAEKCRDKNKKCQIVIDMFTYLDIYFKYIMNNLNIKFFDTVLNKADELQKENYDFIDPEKEVKIKLLCASVSEKIIRVKNHFDQMMG